MIHVAGCLLVLFLKVVSQDLWANLHIGTIHMIDSPI